MLLTIVHHRICFVLKIHSAGELITTMSVASQKYKVPLAVGWKEGDAAGSLLQPQSTADLEALLQKQMPAVVNSRRTV